MTQKTKKKAFEIGPASLKQELFLNSTADITVFGGAAGSGKTHCLLMAYLRFVSDRHTRGNIFRRTTKQITSPGGLWDEACIMYPSIDPKVKAREKDNKFLFSSGATLKFSHMEHEKNKYDHQGSQLSFCAFDEATHFTETQVLYMLSRMRSVNASYTPQMFMTCNPDYNSFLRLWVEWYLDPETGIPREDRAGATRYMLRQGATIHWGDSRKELEDRFSSIDPKDLGILSFKFIPATIMDNPFMLENNPEYLQNLQALPRVEKMRLLYGSWYAKEQAAGYWKKEWCEKVPRPHAKVLKSVRAWDLAGTLPSEANPNPDWTAGVKLVRTMRKTYCIEHVVRKQERVHKIEELIFETAKEDGPETTIILPLDPGASGLAYARGLVQRLADMGYYARLKRPEHSKLVRFSPFAAVCEAGLVEMVEGPWNADFVEELEAFTGEKKNKDDQVDAVADAFWACKTSVDIPNFKVPDFSRTNQFALPQNLRG